MYKFISQFNNSTVSIPGMVIFAIVISVVLSASILAVYFKRLNARLTREIELRRKTEKELVALSRELEQEKERAAALSQEKTQFIANVSHDLRAPVCSVISLSNIFLHNVQTLDLPEKFIRFMGQLHSGAEFLQLMLNNILDYSAFEMNAASVVVEKVDLNKWSESIISVIEPQADLRKVTLDVVTNSVSPIIESDVSRLSQILLNLAHNAIKYSPAGGKVNIGISAAADALEITVIKSGCNISCEDQKHIFDTLYSVSCMESNSSGSDFVLSVVKRNVDLMNGCVSVAYTDGGGAEFKVLIPLESPAGGIS